MSEFLANPLKNKQQNRYETDTKCQRIQLGELVASPSIQEWRSLPFPAQRAVFASPLSGRSGLRRVFGAVPIPREPDGL